MMASELITQLQNAIDQHGDHPVLHPLTEVGVCAVHYELRPGDEDFPEAFRLW